MSEELNLDLYLAPKTQPEAKKESKKEVQNMTPFYQKLDKTMKKVKDFIYLFQTSRQPNFMNVCFYFLIP